MKSNHAYTHIQYKYVPEERALQRPVVHSQVSSHSEQCFWSADVSRPQGSVANKIPKAQIELPKWRWQYCKLQHLNLLMYIALGINWVMYAAAIWQTNRRISTLMPLNTSIFTSTFTYWQMISSHDSIYIHEVCHKPALHACLPMALYQNHSAAGSPILTLALTEVFLATSETGPSQLMGPLLMAPLLFGNHRGPGPPALLIMPQSHQHTAGCNPLPGRLRCHADQFCKQFSPNQLTTRINRPNRLVHSGLTYPQNTRQETRT